MKMISELYRALKGSSLVSKAAKAIVVLSMLASGGCVNALCRTGGYTCWGDPYYPTMATAQGIAFIADEGEPLGAAIMCIDIPFEAVFDTVFLPADLVVKWCKGGAKHD